MKRKRLQEEITLREYVNGYGDSTDMSRLITALVRAVREDCAKVAENYVRSRGPKGKGVFVEEIYAAIRGKK